jgi:hypothetical protein
MARRLLGLLACLGLASGLKVVQLGLDDSQAFADALAVFGDTGEDTILKLPFGRVFSLANATIRSAQKSTAFTSGVLTIEPADGSGAEATVLDAGEVAACVPTKP